VWGVLVFDCAVRRHDVMLVHDPLNRCDSTVNWRRYITAGVVISSLDIRQMPPHALMYS